MIHKKMPHHKIKRIQKLKRHKFHKSLHHAHHKHRMSYKTLYYIKSYHHDKHIWHAIVKQSIGVILIASIISTLGGVWLQSLQSKLTLILPLLIMVPALNSLIGNFGTITSSKFSAYLFMNKIKHKWYESHHVYNLMNDVFAIALFASVYIAVMSTIIGMVNGYALDYLIFFKC